ncbi:MAG: sulfite exporter TauE/SafE family protein [Burkholderiaceae bacterium]
MDIVLITSLLAVGGFVGFLGGLLGIGGGRTMVPFMVMLCEARDFPPGELIKIAIATSLAVNLFTSVSSARAHYRHGAVRTDLLWAMGGGALVGTFLGASVAGALKDSFLAAFFALFVGYSAWQMLKGKKPKPGRDVPGRVGLGLAGSGIGFISSLLGAGGGFLTIPFLTWCNVSMHHAVATSAGLAFPIALGGLVGYVLAGQSVANLPVGSVGYIYLPALASLASASVITAPWGARVAHRTDVPTLRRWFAYLLFCLAAYMLSRVGW